MIYFANPELLYLLIAIPVLGLMFAVGKMLEPRG